MTSLYTSPVAVTGVLFAISNVWLLRRVPVSYVMFLAMVFFLAGSILLATVPINQTYWLQTFFSIIIMPGAMNLSFPAATILLSSALPREKQGIAASLVATLVNYCIASGLGFAGTIHRHSLESAAKRNGAVSTHKRPPPSVSTSSSEINAIRIEGMRGPWWFMVGLSGLGVLIAGVFILRTRKTSLNT
jgi:MFS family permease